MHPSLWYGWKSACSKDVEDDLRSQGEKHRQRVGAQQQHHAGHEAHHVLAPKAFFRLKRQLNRVSQHSRG